MNWTDAENLTARYEALRRAALGQESPAGHGLAMVIHRGVSAWMPIWWMQVFGWPRPTPPYQQSRARNCSELVQTLTNLALGAIRG